MEEIVKKAEELEAKFSSICDLSCHRDKSNCKYLEYLKPDCIFMWFAEELLKVEKNKENEWSERL